VQGIPVQAVLHLDRDVGEAVDLQMQAGPPGKSMRVLSREIKGEITLTVTLPAS
jgi:hypothetical protein